MITDILTAIGVNVWQLEYVREYVLHTKLFFSFFLCITQIFLSVCFSGQINHIYTKILSIIIV